MTNILLFDQNDHGRIARRLRDDGHNVDIVDASSSDAVLEKIKSAPGHYDLFLMSWKSLLESHQNYTPEDNSFLEKIISRIAHGPLTALWQSYVNKGMTPNDPKWDGFLKLGYSCLFCNNLREAGFNGVIVRTMEGQGEYKNEAADMRNLMKHLKIETAIKHGDWLPLLINSVHDYLHPDGPKRTYDLSRQPIVNGQNGATQVSGGDIASRSEAIRAELDRRFPLPRAEPK